MTPNRPYLLRALNEWILDNGMTPHILVDASIASVDVPRNFIQDNQIILNIHPDAVNQLVLGNDAITFSARFSGKISRVYVPMNSVTAIYARETGMGLVFPAEQESGTENTAESGKPHLKIIK